MKRMINTVCAMSAVNAKLCKQLGLYVEVEQRDEGTIPHMHVYHDKSRTLKNVRIFVWIKQLIQNTTKCIGCLKSKKNCFADNAAAL